MHIPEDVWNKFLENYYPLLLKICRCINGDNVISNNEDFLQDLYIAGIEGIRGFCKTNKREVSLELFEDRIFDKYIKTVLWNKKNNSGAKITERKNITSSVELDPNITAGHRLDETLINESLSQTYKALYGEERIVLDTILTEPSVLNKKGKLCKKSVARFTDIPYHRVLKIMKDLSDKIQENAVCL